MSVDDILDDVFHGCAFAAFIEEAAEAGVPPVLNGPANGPTDTSRRLWQRNRAEQNHCAKIESVAWYT